MQVGAQDVSQNHGILGVRLAGRTTKYCPDGIAITLDKRLWGLESMSVLLSVDRVKSQLSY